MNRHKHTLIIVNTDKPIVFFCHPYHRGGVTRWMADAAIAYAKQNKEVYFVTVEPEKEFVSAKGRETLLQLLQKEPNTIKIIEAPVGYEFELGTPEYRAFVYKKLLAKIPLGSNIILSDDAVVWEAATTFHNSFAIIGVLHADEDHYYNLAKKHYGQVSAFACVSERVTRTLKTSAPKADSKAIYTIPCGINLPAFSTTADTGNLLQLVYLGRISDYQKRTADLVKIAAALAQQNIPFHLNIIGDGETRQPLEQKFISGGLQQFVTFTGWLSQQQVAAHLREADMLVMTSDFEGTPIAMMEALAAGCGMTGTRVSGIEDYEDHPLAKDCLMVYNVGDTNEAVDKIMRLAAIPKTIRRESARKLAEAEFSMGVCLSRYNVLMTNIDKQSAPLPTIKMSAKDMLRSAAIATARQLKLKLSR